MRKAIWAAIFLGACTNSFNDSLGTGTQADRNIIHLYELRSGMTQEEVFQIMKFPVCDEEVVLDDGCYDVWFYVTRHKVLGQKDLTPHNLTPVIFRDGVYVAKGYEFYYRILRTKEREQRVPLVPQEPEPENQELEKVLKPSGKTSFLQRMRDQASLAMCSRVRPEPTPPPQQDEDDSREGYDYEKDDEEMMEEEQEQDFNQW